MAKKKEEAEVSAFSQLDDLISKTFDDIQDASKLDNNVSSWYSWGNYALNYICTKNLFHGVPAGRISSVKGLSAVGKSLLIASVAKDPKVDMVIAIESEGNGFTPELFQFAGGDTKKLRLLRCSTLDNYRINKSNGKIEEVADEKMPAKFDTDQYLYVEGVIRKVKRLIHSIQFSDTPKANIILIVDSLANLQSTREKQGTCFPGETLIVTDDGKKEIRNIKIGDKVLTHLGVFEDVEDICSYSKEDKPELIEIETEDGDVIKMTLNHPVLVKRSGEFEWVKAKDLTEEDEIQKLSI